MATDNIDWAMRANCMPSRSRPMEGVANRARYERSAASAPNRLCESSGNRIRVVTIISNHPNCDEIVVDEMNNSRTKPASELWLWLVIVGLVGVVMYRTTYANPARPDEMLIRNTMGKLRVQS